MSKSARVEGHSPFARILRLFQPTRWLALAIFSAGIVIVVMNTMNLWAGAWLHRPPEVVAALICIALGATCNLMGARLYYLAKDYRDYVAIRDKALKVHADVEGFLKDVGEARARGGEIVGVIIREESGARRAIYDDDPEPPRVIH